MNNIEELKRVIEYKMPLWRENINLFARDMFAFEADEWQKKGFEDVVNRNRVAIKSGQGVGKTAFTAVVVWWFISCFPFPKIICTAPTRQQLHDVLWAELAKWQQRSPVLKRLFKWTKTYIYFIGQEERWFATARTATKPENMQGFHEDNLLFIVDEASGVNDDILQAIIGTLSGGNNKLIMLSNPTKRSGIFFDAFNSDVSMYARKTVNAEDVSRVNRENIEMIKRKFGESSNVYRVRVLGEFPLEEDDVFITEDLIRKSIQTEISIGTQIALGINGYKQNPEKIYQVDIGCDVARFGNDRTCITYRINEVVKIYKKVNGKNTTWTTGSILQLYRHIREVYRYDGDINVKVDDGGVGGGVVDQLRAAQERDPYYKGMLLRAINFGQPIHHRYYYDTTTYMLGVIRDLILPYDDEGNKRKPQLILPDDDEMIAEFSCRKYDFVTGGKQKVESKKAMKERNLPSPDIADSIALTCLPVPERRRK